MSESTESRSAAAAAGRPMSPHLPHERVHHEPETGYPDCGGALVVLGEGAGVRTRVLGMDR